MGILAGGAKICAVVISFNRGRMLERCISGLLKQTAALEIVVHDNGSDDPETVRILDHLESSGIAVVRDARIQNADQLNRVAQTVERHTAGDSQQDFLVTDCDIDLGWAHPEALEVYAWMLHRHPEAECVGPMLTIRDIPAHYPLRNRAMKGHVEQFWGRVPEVEQSPFGLVASIGAPIDTTLALHRGGQPFRRLRPGRRVYHPFEARHLDWYISRQDFAAGVARSDISHWSNSRWLEQEGLEAPPDLTYFVAMRSGPRSLCIEQRSTNDPPEPTMT